MAKKALLDVLEQTIGKYVRNLDAESLNVAVWSGKIALTNLELDVDAVNAELDRQAAEAPNLAVPLEVIKGKFESLQVDVPWASLTSRSVVLRAKGLHVHVRPRDRLATTDHLQASVASEEARAEKIRTAREQSIQLSEKYRQQALAVRKLAAESEPTKQSFSSRLVRRILENIQIEIQNVHISLTDAEGSAGVVLESLSLVTTDRDGKQVFVDRTTGHDQTFFVQNAALGWTWPLLGPSRLCHGKVCHLQDHVGGDFGNSIIGSRRVKLSFLPGSRPSTFVRPGTTFLSSETSTSRRTIVCRICQIPTLQRVIIPIHPFVAKTIRISQTDRHRSLQVPKQCSLPSLSRVQTAHKGQLATGCQGVVEVCRPLNWTIKWPKKLG